MLNVGVDLSLAFYADERRHRLSERTRRLFPMVIAHLGAAARLRGTQTDRVVDAWLSPSGQMLDARGAAKEPAHRRLLTSAVQQSERARGSLRRTSPEEALKVWQGLVQAEWSLVDTVERDGKRFVLARRNRPDVPQKVSLTETERSVAYFTAAGHSQKYVGYELGISASTVAHHLRSALVKLGIRSRVELARIYGGGQADNAPIHG
jgi:DNA-binding CsgD family transcriptional regulator